MPATQLNNITIQEKQDIQGRTYYLIVNNDNQDEAYFCFSGVVKTGWNELVSNWQSIKEVEIEFTEQDQGFKIYRKVVSLELPQEETIIY